MTKYNTRKGITFK